MASPAAPLRTLLPAVCRSPHEPPTPVHRVERRSKRRSLACSSCQRKKVKCSGPPPYGACAATNSDILRPGKEDDVNNLVKEIQKVSSLDSALGDLQSLISRRKS
ncbi:hypothetical protein BDV41DRAFT_556210 [Aspergillus transmontanensis]|uniref:Zn(2)-C6 fungal-type domain-containing protein n=1 Tax=Aspergillus transmontanensis TaxID=1034304 RepID=A0A5N6VIL3_9EURO|nr:hypothetical protein BDV41DRAFT_556210 [Aspergillus transmontanensis]